MYTHINKSEHGNDKPIIYSLILQKWSRLRVT